MLRLAGLLALLACLVAAAAAAAAAASQRDLKSSGAVCFHALMDAQKSKVADAAGNLTFVPTPASIKAKLIVAKDGGEYSTQLTYSISSNFKLKNKQKNEIIAWHVHVGTNKENLQPLVFFCGQPPFPITGQELNGLPTCPQTLRHTFHKSIFSFIAGNAFPSETAFYEALFSDPSGFYLNMHTTGDVPGLLRGQLTKSKC